MVEYTDVINTDVVWLPQIPAHWQLQKIGALFTERKTKVSDKDYAPLSVTKKGILPQLEHAAKSIDSDNRKLVKAGDFVINSRSDRKGSCGVSKFDGSVSLINLVLTPRSGLNNDYVHYLLRNYKFSEEYYRNGRGIVADLWTTRYSEMRTILLPVPPRAEQDQIVRFLDWKVSKANTLINIKKKEIKSVESLKHSAVSDAVTHGLTADIPMKYSGVKWLGDIPAHWTTIKLRQLLSSVSEKNHPELPLLSVVREQGVIVRDVDDKEANHNYIPDDLSGYKMVKKGQFVMNKMKAWQGSYGISDYTGIVSPAYFIFDVAFDNLEYFHYAIRSKVYVNFFAQASDGIRVGQWDLQMDKMKEIPFIVPSADEQIAIVEHIKKTLPKYDEAIEKIKAEVAVLEEYKAKLIADIVTGKIDVRNITVPEYEHVDDIVDDDLENNEETEIDGEEA
ncbi:restriction endonuclease subunit S [Lactobacillus delbrueckii]|uniref:restriction endonuclease subunit S n=1 Tax=Lactobacillus delbrueckii TaxID=1584 RepID=UPI000230D659|nr:restriction endonuclease subunit S [Lactobacillus delbrueckii]EHE91398.1 Type I site-specific deoxyribonuclease [Lactobacillus delbrueckii subsp. bulgaricus CNCM I-1632]MBS4915478.1 restriction endonuclease subunit S [Lactobacillus delbrueckii]MCD5467635.1 restriction endonuclease subunit S [Lactobacillus delbrueckii subsp. bulgaricus]MCD5483334.1 restriction endonuclease subunit S [Lactobacillus delbrueckii subsp. bulgaricus]MCT3474025.1 restriction endonuclease subunit S [Lactobacillus de